jgi:CheY-like chemotaxis protein
MTVALQDIHPPEPSAARRVLVVEDEWFIAMAMTEALQRHGVIVLGPFSSVDLAKQALTAGYAIDAAILDIKLPDGDVYELAERLRARNIPIGFHTGWNADSIPDNFRGTPYWEKPCDVEEIAAWFHRLARTPSFNDCGAAATAPDLQRNGDALQLPPDKEAGARSQREPARGFPNRDD